MTQAITQFLLRLTAAPPAGSQVHAYTTHAPASAARRHFPPDFPDWLQTLLRRQGIEQLSEPQFQALERLQQGAHVCLGLPTGGGCGVVRLLTLYQSLLRSEPVTSLMIFPYKQRELAQFRTLTAWNEALAPAHRLTAAVYDGDTPWTQRRRIKQTLPRVLLTTPEMLHTGILAYHGGWRAFLQQLRYVMLADIHLCSGALGSHLAHLLRRLQRLAEHYGAVPQYLLTSAPVANLVDIASVMTGGTTQVITGDAVATQTQSRVLLKAATNPLAVCHELVARHRAAGLQPLILTSQALNWDEVEMPELAQGVMGTDVQEMFHTAELHLLEGPATAVALPADTPVAAIHPHALSSVIFLGLPASLALMHDYLTLCASQQPYSVSTLIVQGQTLLERYVLRYPEVYQTLWPQELVLYPSNPSIAMAHLHCAAAELALGAGERYAGIHGVGNLIQHLAEAGMIARRAESPAWVAIQRRPHRGVRLRRYTPSGAVVHMLDGRFLASITPTRAFREGFEGAIYNQDGVTWRVERQARDGQRLLVQATQAAYLTRGMVHTQVTDTIVEASVAHDTCRVTTGTCLYTETLRGFERLEVGSQARLSLHLLPERQRQYRTQGVWLSVLATTTPVALHTLVHAVLASLPLACLCAADDLHGGVYAETDATAPMAIFNDVTPGGNGVSQALYQSHVRLLRLGLQLLSQCDCQYGCNRCVGSLRCDACAHNIPVERQAGISLLQDVLGEVLPSLASVTTPSPAAVKPEQRVLYMALSTQKSADEVGGWQHKHLLGLGVAVTYDTQDGRYRVYTAETVAALIESLRSVDLIVGFNTRDFDYDVLQPYSPMPLSSLPTLAVLDDVQKVLGFRLSLRHLVQETLGLERPDDSLETLHWYRDGDRERIAQQCRRDLDLVRALMQHGIQTGTLAYCDPAGHRHTLPVSWSMATEVPPQAVRR